MREARVARLFRALQRNGTDVEVMGVVKTSDGFPYPHREYVCRADRVAWKVLKVPLKLLEILFVSVKAYRENYRDYDLVIVANHEFLFFGLLLRIFTRTAVVVDLHEHYYARLFRTRRFSSFLFLRAFSGVIFANRIRAIDFLAQRANSAEVVIARNFPDVPPGVVVAPKFTPTNKYRVGIVGGNVPGRYIRETVQALDKSEFRDKIELVTFGKPLGFNLKQIAISEHGTYRHWEILGLLKTVDCSMIFYDPSTSVNNRFCEPNRFFEAYNSGLTIFCFDHPSLSDFYDKFCEIIDREKFEIELRRKLEKAIEIKKEALREPESAPRLDRRLLVFDEGAENLDFLLQLRKN